MIIDWRGVRIVVESDEDFEYFRYAIDMLMLPYTLVKGGASMMIECCKTVEIRVGPLVIPVKFVDWCHTSGCYAQVYVKVPSDHPLRELIKRVVEKTWTDAVELATVRVHDEVVQVKVLKWRVKAETVEAECQDSNRRAVFMAPLGVFKKNLEALGKSQVLKVFEDAKKIVEEVERRFKSEQDEEVDVEFLEKRLRKSYLSYFSFDELDVEF